MKKFFAILLTLSLALTALMLPAMAEDTASDSTTSATSDTRNITAQGPGRNGQNGPMGNRNGQMGPMNNNRSSQNGQAPDFSQAPNGQNGQNSQNGQAPDFSQAPNGQNGQNSQNGQAPDFSQAPDGQNGPMGALSFEGLLKDGVIDQDTYDAIVSYMKENAPAAPETSSADTDTDESTTADAADGTLPQGKPGDGKMPPEKPADDNGTTPPEKPADDNGTTPPEKPADGSPESDLLKKLVEDGILTQDQADTILTEIGTTSDASTSTDTDEIVNG